MPKDKHVEAKQYATKKTNGSLNTKEEILENLETNDNENNNVVCSKSSYMREAYTDTLYKETRKVSNKKIQPYM